MAQAPYNDLKEDRTMSREHLRQISNPSMWTVKYTTFNFFQFLIQLKLTGRQIPKAQIEKLIRRHRSQYDRSSGQTPSIYDGGLI